MSYNPTNRTNIGFGGGVASTPPQYICAGQYNFHSIPSTSTADSSSNLTSCSLIHFPSSNLFQSAQPQMKSSRGNPSVVRNAVIESCTKRGQRKWWVTWKTVVVVVSFGFFFFNPNKFRTIELERLLDCKWKQRLNAMERKRVVERHPRKDAKPEQEEEQKYE